MLVLREGIAWLTGRTLVIAAVLAPFVDALSALQNELVIAFSTHIVGELQALGVRGDALAAVPYRVACVTQYAQSLHLDYAFLGAGIAYATVVTHKYL